MDGALCSAGGTPPAAPLVLTLLHAAQAGNARSAGARAQHSEKRDLAGCLRALASARCRCKQRKLLLVSPWEELQAEPSREPSVRVPDRHPGNSSGWRPQLGLHRGKHAQGDSYGELENSRPAAGRGPRPRPGTRGSHCTHYAAAVLDWGLPRNAWQGYDVKGMPSKEWEGS